MKKITILSLLVILLPGFSILTTNPLFANEEIEISNIRLDPNPIFLGEKCWLTVDFKSKAPLKKVYVYVQYYINDEPTHDYLFQVVDVRKTLPEIAGKTEGQIKTWWLFKNPKPSKREFRIWAEDENHHISKGLFLSSTHILPK